MNKTIDERIEAQLDRLENPLLTEREIELIEKKILLLVMQKQR